MLKQKTMNVVPQDTRLFEKDGINIYESIVILGKRARQNSTKFREELNNKLKDFETSVDTLEEIHENKEQIEISKYFEKLQKPTLNAIDEFLENKIYFQNPNKQTTNENGSDGEEIEETS